MNVKKINQSIKDLKHLIVVSENEILYLQEKVCEHPKNHVIKILKKWMIGGEEFLDCRCDICEKKWMEEYNEN